jgi:hypothetical protein
MNENARLSAQVRLRRCPAGHQADHVRSLQPDICAPARSVSVHQPWGVLGGGFFLS